MAVLESLADEAPRDNYGTLSPLAVEEKRTQQLANVRVTRISTDTDLDRRRQIISTQSLSSSSPV